MADHSVRRAPLVAQSDDVVVLTTSELACFQALGHDTTRKTRIAIATKLDLPKTSAALEKLERLGFIRRDELGGGILPSAAEPARSEPSPTGSVATTARQVAAGNACCRRWSTRCGATNWLHGSASPNNVSINLRSSCMLTALFGWETKVSRFTLSRAAMTQPCFCPMNKSMS